MIVRNIAVYVRVSSEGQAREIISIRQSGRWRCAATTRANATRWNARNPVCLNAELVGQLRT